MGEAGWVKQKNEVWNQAAALLQLATEDHLPLSVRYAAAQAATDIVDAWIAGKQS